MKRWAQALALAAVLHGVALLAFFFLTRGVTVSVPAEPTAPRAAPQRVTRVMLNGRSPAAPEAPPPLSPIASPQTPTTQIPTTQTPTAQTPSAQTPSAQTPTTQTPTTQTPTTQTPTTQTPTTQTPTAQTPTAQTPTAQTPTAQTPTAQSPTAQSPTAQSPTAQSPTAQSPQGAPSSSAENPTGAGRGTADGAPSSETGGVDVEALVHARLSAAAVQCYPAAAKRFRQRGVVEVSFCADRAAGATQRAVKRSSGSDLLDRAAVECVLTNASPLPAEASGRCFALPVRFGQ